MTPPAGHPDAHLREAPVDSEQVYRGHFLDVRRDRVQLPDGSLAQREYIVHPGAAMVVPLQDDGSLVLEYLPGEAYRLYIREATEIPPDSPVEVQSPPVVRPPATAATPTPAAASIGPAFGGEGFEAYLEFEGQVDGHPHRSFFSFPLPPQESGLRLQPEINWNGNRFEGLLRYEKPAPELWDDRRKAIAKLRWEVQYRVFGSIAADRHSLEGITFQYKAECRMDDGTLWEYYEGSYALTNVPGQGRVLLVDERIGGAEIAHDRNAVRQTARKHGAHQFLQQRFKAALGVLQAGELRQGQRAFCEGLEDQAGWSSGADEGIHHGVGGVDAVAGEAGGRTHVKHVVVCHAGQCRRDPVIVETRNSDILIRNADHSVHP